MLATISHPAHNLSQSMRYSHSPTSSGPTLPEPATPVENKICPGCQLTVMDENGGVVIAFGQSFFHVDCFQCAKCKDRVTADTNLLLLSDGQPVCSNCSYSCSVCHQPILDEAIMTGDDSYHAHCFKCRSCHNRIDELMFAKTSHGIYCMKCHHQRVARSRRHAQKQKERENAGREAKSHVHPIKEELVPPANAPTGLFTPDSAPNAQSVSSTSSAQTSPTRTRPMTSPVTGDSDRSRPQSSQNGRRDERRSAPYPSTTSLQSSHRSSQNMLPSPTSPSAVSPQAGSNTPPTYSSGPSSPVIVVPQVPEAGPQIALSYFLHEVSNGNGTATPFLTPDAPASLERRRSYDDGTRPLNVLFKETPPPGSAHSDKLSATELNNKPFSAPQSPSQPPSFEISDHTNTRPLPLKAQNSGGLSRQPSRRAHAETPASAPAVAGSMLDHSRNRTASSPRPLPGFGPIGLSSRPDMPERFPPRTHSLKGSSQDPEARVRHRPSTPSIKTSAPGRSSDEKDRPKPGSSLSIDVERSRAGYGKRPMSPAYKAPSPAHKVDVPHSIESGTDTSDGEREPSASERIPLPSKEQETILRRQPVHLELDMKKSASQEEHGEGVSFLSSGGDADSEGESSPVERVSRSTFIAPAHPPIRFSVSGNGFQELLSQIDPRNRSSLLIIEELVKLSQDAEARLDSDPSAASLTPNSGPADTEGRRSSTPASALTPTTNSGRAPDNSSVTTLSAPSSQGHDDTSMGLDQSVTTNGAERALLRQRSMRNALSPPSSRSSSERSHDRAASEAGQHGHFDPSVFAHHTDASLSGTSSQFTAPESSITRQGKLDPSYAVTKRLQDALQDAARRGTTQIALDQEFVQAVVMMIEQRRDENAKMKGRLDHIKRASQRVMGGLVSSNEYEAEHKARRDAEAEVTRLRVLLSGQAARITALSGQGRKDELHRQLLGGLRDNLNVLEHDVAKLKVERDVALVEMEEIASSRGSAVATVEMDGIGLSRSLSTRLDNLKVQYKGELVSLIDERESLFHEIAELQTARDVFLEETTMLNARNEELAQLNAHYMRRIEAISSESSMPAQEKRLSERERERQHPPVALQSSHTVNSSIGASSDEGHDLGKYMKSQQKPSSGDAHSRVFKWRGNNKDTNAAASAAHTQDGPNEKTWPGHTFQQVSVLRISKCDHCSEKLWGSQARCQACHISVHPRCQQSVYVGCSPQHNSRRDDGSAPGTLQPTTFGRELTEQVRVDSKVTERMVPLIVERCIAAVEASALDYEGIYRKTGGSALSKLVTQLFERGDYSAFDLLDGQRFNDICSVTSVLKSYLRALPNPLLTFVLHDEFIYAATIQDPMHKSAKYADLVKQLPTEHYYTLRALMFHLHRIQEHHAENFMTARNLGVVFGPTLMRSRNPAAEFSDMAGKALTIEWLVENAPTVFPPLSTSH